MDVEQFIARWTAREGGAERANYQMFLAELCDVLGVPRPDPSGPTREHNDYVFERAVRPRSGEAVTAPKRIDLYKKGAFILEAKQSRLPGGGKAIPGQAPLFAEEPEELGKAGAARGWDAMMQNARRQAEGYVFLLDASHPAPPFVIVCDVGHCLEIYADFTGTGRAYDQFPDRKAFRVFLQDLRDPDIRARLAKIWTDPASLDPARHAARVTRAIAERLAEVSKALEKTGADAEDVAHFLMRCLFTMFAEDVDLLPKDSFKALLRKSVEDPPSFPHRLKALWQDMDRGTDYSHVVEERVRHFNGGLFKETTVFPLGREEIGELLRAAEHRWTDVDPAIFGTLLEQALDPKERKRLGAHYTPRAYVQRLVEVTVMEPLRADWQAALTKAEQAKEDGKEKDAVAIVRAFHHTLCTTRVLDPACGTGNFLYVALELIKKLEGEVLETLAKLGVSEMLGLETVDPHQFLGLELNPRAAAIAELVVWIGYLQQHYRTRTGHPSEPILRAFENINFGRHAGYDAVLTWDGFPLPKVVEKDGKRIEIYPNARRPVWPEAEFIVGNPPFIKGSEIRDEKGNPYAEALWSVYDHISGGADYVMFWWDQAALYLRKWSTLRRFGLVTTNKISQGFSRDVVVHNLFVKPVISIVWAIDDHPWYRGNKGTAQVRIAMTVSERGDSEGRLFQVVLEDELETDHPRIELRETAGRINPDLTVGVDVTKSSPLVANSSCSHDGVKLHGKAFIVAPSEANLLGLGSRQDLENHIRPYRNGMDLKGGLRPLRLVIDMYGLNEFEVRSRFPEAYQHLLAVRHERQAVIDKIREKGREPSKDLMIYVEYWWIFGKPRPELRPALEGLRRYIGTIDTARHRAFQFLDADVVCADKVVVIASDDAWLLSILSSRTHVAWATRAGGWLGVGNDPVYVKTRTFDPFPFPDPPEALRQKLRDAGEELDALRKKVQAEHPDLTLTGLYNVLEKIRAKTPLTEKDEDVKQRGLVLILKELHDTIDRLTAEAYGWPENLADEEILERLVALNAERAREEAEGHVRWLRPDYQIPRFGKKVAAKTGELALEEKVVAIDRGLPAFPAGPYEQPLAVEAVLLSAGRPMDAADISRAFKGRSTGARVKRIGDVLATLARYGRITPGADGRYAARKAA